MLNIRIEARPWCPQDLIDDLQQLIDEEPDNYLNFRLSTLLTAQSYLKEFFGIDQKPLSIEELREMNGEPVWVAGEETWAIVCVDDHGQFKGRPFAMFRWKNVRCDYDIEKRGLRCYRHKPKED